MGLMKRAAGGAVSPQRVSVDAADLAHAAVELLGGGQGGALGGLGGLRDAFGRAGLSPEFESWVATGANRSITAAQLGSALGAQAISRLAQSVGADPARVAAGLAEILPRVVDQLTPAGVLPEGSGERPAAAGPPLGRR